MKHTTTQQLHAYWQSIRRGRPAPDRSEIEPSDIRSILGDTFILEVAGPASYRFRLAGTRVCAIFGRELKGREFQGLWSGKDREVIESLLLAISEEGAAAVLGSAGHTDTGRNLPMEILLLPVRQNGPGFQRILGSIAPMDTPFWLGIYPVMTQAISSLRLIFPTDQDRNLRSTRDLEMETRIEDDIAMIEPSFIGGQPPASTRAPHLRLIQGGKS